MFPLTRLRLLSLILRLLVPTQCHQWFRYLHFPLLRRYELGYLLAVHGALTANAEKIPITSRDPKKNAFFIRLPLLSRDTAMSKTPRE